MRFAKVKCFGKNGEECLTLINLGKVQNILEIKKSEYITENFTIIDFGNDQVRTYDSIDTILDSVITFK